MDNHAAPIVRALILILALFLLAASPATAQSDRPISVAPTIGYRNFDSELDLNGEITAGLRFGVDASPKFGILMDYVYTSPSRESSGGSANVHAMRALAKYRLLTSSVRPYLLAGVGGLLFDFEDTFDTASFTLSLGGGAEYRLGSRASLFAEASADGYRARTVTYSSTGEELESTERETQAVMTATAGIAVEF